MLEPRACGVCSNMNMFAIVSRAPHFVAVSFALARRQWCFGLLLVSLCTRRVHFRKISFLRRSQPSVRTQPHTPHTARIFVHGTHHARISRRSCISAAASRHARSMAQWWCDGDGMRWWLMCVYVPLRSFNKRALHVVSCAAAASRDAAHHYRACRVRAHRAQNTPVVAGVVVAVAATLAKSAPLLASPNETRRCAACMNEVVALDARTRNPNRASRRVASSAAARCSVTLR